MTLGRDGEEVGAVVPAHGARVDQAHVGLVDQRRRLQRVVRPLPPHVAPSQPMQLGLDERDQAIERRLLPVAPGQQQSGDVVGRGVGHQRPPGPEVSSDPQRTTGADTTLPHGGGIFLPPAAGFSAEFRFSR